MIKSLLKNNWIHFVAVAVFFIVTIVNFYPQFQGKRVQAGDYVSINATQNEVNQYRKETGDISLWTNALFGGMPTYYIAFPRNKDLVDYTHKFLKGFMQGESGFFFFGMISFYLLMILLGISPMLAIFGSIAFSFTTNNIILLDTGHMTKLATISTCPMVIAGVLLAYRKKWLLGFVVFALGMAINLKSDHPQMTYYLAIVLIPYIVLVFIDYLKKKDLKDFFVASAILLGGLALGVGCTASKLLPVYEYSKDTMRGKPILQTNNSTTSSSSVEGLAWDYAMSWSNGLEDLLSSFIPLSVGGSSAEMISSKSNFAKELRKRGMKTSDGVQAPMYWGSLPFTSGPIYFGAVIFLLFFIALFHYKDHIRWWILIAFCLTALLSMGKNFEILSRLFFDYFPMYNKFRTPNSILSVTAVIVPILAILGLQNILTVKKLNFKKILYPGLGLALFCLIIGALGPGFSDMSSASDSRYVQMGLDQSILIADRSDLMSSSAYRSGILMLLSLGFLYLYSKDKIRKQYVILGIGLLSIFDIFSTNLRYLKPSDYVSKRSYQNNFQPRDVDLQIKKDLDPNYRVFDLSISTFDNSSSSYHHKTIGGYHAAKLQRYQDLIDYHITKNNMDVLNMLNAKYIITPGSDNAPIVQRNPAALGNAWYVNNYRIVNSAEEEIDGLNDFDPLGEAIVHQEFSSYLNGLSINKNGSIKLTSYKPNELIYSSSCTSEQLAVFSEIWYGPNKGWNAYVDDKPAEHIRVNYILRGLKVPAGDHTIRFEFKPASARIGSLISLISSFLIIGSLLFLLYKSWVKK